MKAPATAPAATSSLLEAYRDFAGEQRHDRNPATLYTPIRYAMEARGKAVRPALLLLAHQLGGRDLREALPAAYAVELFHNFTLVHDDIMDEAELRRGRPTVHAAFGTATAILAGDAMLIRTYGYLLDAYAGELAVELLRVFQEMATALCEGQQRDMDLEAGHEATYAEYLQMIAGKTGVLLTACLRMGGLIGRLAPEAVETLARAGDLAGRAFQVQDDLLDTFRTSAVTGKADYGDVVRGKQSAPYVRALEMAGEADADRLRQLYAAPPAERTAHLREILDLYARLGVEKSLAEEVGELTTEALGLIDAVPSERAARARLVEFVRRLALRAF